MIKPKDHYLDLNGLRLHYLDWGNQEKRPLLLLHGFMAHAHVWDDLAMSFRNDNHVLALDQRGHGESQWSVEGAYTIYDHFLDISGMVESLHLDPVILMGHSMGGRNALFYAACSPQKVAKLILVDARPGNSPQASEALKRLLLHLPLMANSLDEVGKAIQSLYPSLSAPIGRQMARHGYKQGEDGKFVPRYDTRMGLDSERSGYAAEDLWPFLKNLTCPTLIVRGKESPFLSLEEAKKMGHLIPNGKWSEIPGATHMPAQENPGMFRKVISKFIKASK